MFENRWPELIMSEKYRTVLTAILAHNRPGYNTVVIRIGSNAATPGDHNPSAPRVCIASVLAYQQVQEIRIGDVPAGRLC